MNNRFSENIKTLRIEAKLTQIQLAKTLGLSQRKISYLENGTIEPSIDTIIQFAKFFDVSTDYLLGLED